MRKLLTISLSLLLFAACKNQPEPIDPINPDEPKGLEVKFTETDESFANPERGWLIQSYYTSADLDAHLTLNSLRISRNGVDHVTVYLHSYYLTDYMESDIPQAFMDRFETNMNTLREGGAKAVLRFSYKSNEKDAPWDATPEWVHKHIDQIAPYLKKHSDVILCVQCGFIGVWGEWYYTTNFKMNPTKDEDFELRWKVLEHLLQAVPEDRQVALRTPEFKMHYLRMRGLGDTPLTEKEAFQNTNKARICGHNDCFVSSSSDVGTYKGTDDRAFWREDTKYTFMGGETCQKCQYSNGSHAISEMEAYHWTYINRDYHQKVTSSWRSDGSADTIARRLGYRFALEKVILTETPKAEQKFDAYCVLNNRGFAAPINKRGLELVFVSVSNPSQKFVFPQTEDPRFWQPGEHRFTLSCTLAAEMKGEYKLYLNLPDPYPSLHDDPKFSIRLANEKIWEEATGYNFISNIMVE